MNTNILKAQKGNTEGLLTLYNQNKHSVKHICKLLLCNEEAANEDS